MLGSGMDRKSFQALAIRHLEDSECLLQSDRAEGAYYLAGYAVECALKACIAKNTKEHDFPPDPKFVLKLYTHDLNALLKLAGLESQLKTDAPPGSSLDGNFAIVYRWSEQSRYRPILRQEADELVAAINDPKIGVLQWLKQNW